jgi:aminoglycoside phosphotransferase (APT) family kinase protein
VSAVAGALTSAELGSVREVLSGAGEVVDGALAAELLTSGRSNVTVLLRDRSQRWVLRTPPRAGRTPSAHDVAREHRVTSALVGTGVPVPRAVALCEDESVLGGPFAIAAFVDGASVQSRSEFDELEPAQRDRIGPVLAATLASLHAVDPGHVGLRDFARWDGYTARQLGRWRKQWALVGDQGTDGLAQEVSDRLLAAVPEQERTSIVHGDFRIDNTIVGLGSSLSVNAVVDWELSTLGDPVADVAMMCAYRLPAFDHVIGERAAWTSPELPAVVELAAAYEAAGGAPLTNFDFHLGLAYFKIAVIAAGIAHRARESAIEKLEKTPPAAVAVEPFLVAALETLRLRHAG